MSPSGQIEQPTPEQVQAFLQDILAKQQEVLGSAATMPQPDEKKNATTTANSAAGGPFSILAQHKEALEAYLEQYAVQLGILNYKAANSAFIDAVNTAKIMGIGDAVKDKIVPFPSNNKNITIMQAPQSVPSPPQQYQPQPQPVPTPTPDPVSTGNKVSPLTAALATLALLGAGAGGSAILDKYFPKNATVTQTQTTAPQPTPQNPIPLQPATPDQTNGLSIEVY